VAWPGAIRARVPAATLPILLAACAIGLAVPRSASAELSTESLLGPALRSQPAYDGSDSQRWQLVPVLRILGPVWFARSTQDVLEGGVRAPIAPGMHAGVQLAYEPGRKTAESAFLRTHVLPDVDPGASVGAQIEFDRHFGPAPVTLLIRARRHADPRRGTQVDLRLSAGVFRRGPVAAAVLAETTWANARSTNSFYGITPAESSLDGLPAFAAGGGYLSATFGGGARLDLSREWVLVGSLESHRLLGNAARSPITERLSNGYAALGLAYRF
jgi:outer membrane protein